MKVPISTLILAMATVGAAQDSQSLLFTKGAAGYVHTVSGSSGTLLEDIRNYVRGRPDAPDRESMETHALNLRKILAELN